MSDIFLRLYSLLVGKQNVRSNIFPQEKQLWKRFVSETFLVLGSMLLLTLTIMIVPLSPRVPDSLLLYLLLILVFAAVWGLYAAFFASFVAFFTFDFFFVPPVYDFSAAKFEDIFSLIVFLLAAIITGRLASSLHAYTIQARRREYEARTLYEFIRATNREDDMEQQLRVFVKTVVDVFSSWGIRDCMLLLSDTQDVLQPQESARHLLNEIIIEPDEEMALAWVMVQGRTLDLYSHTFSSESIARTTSPAGTVPLRSLIRLIPLKTESRVFGVLRLLIDEQEKKRTWATAFGLEQPDLKASEIFFSTFLEQAVTVIEQGRLRDATIGLQVLQKTEALRSALFSSVSHDLRTPLATIKAAATALIQEVPSSLAITIEREVDRLDGLVENVLDMSRIEAGSLRLEKVWYSLDELVSDAISHLHDSLRDRVVSVIEETSLPPIELDAVQIEQVLINLLENTVRYTPPGSPIDISLQQQDQFLQVTIADCGPGIPLAEREHIFEKFYRLNSKHDQPAHPRGLGLGLAICSGIIQAHGGEIWVEDREGGGASFCFTLPLSNLSELDIDDDMPI